MSIRIRYSYCYECSWSASTADHTRQELTALLVEYAVETSMERADRVRGIAPEARQRYVEVFADHIFRQRTDVGLILEQETIANLDEYYTAQWRGALEHPNCTIWQAETVPPFGLIIVDQSDVWIGVYQDGGGLIGTLHNDSRPAVEWAQGLYERYREDAEHVVLATNGDAP